MRYFFNRAPKVTRHFQTRLDEHVIQLDAHLVIDVAFDHNRDVVIVRYGNVMKEFYPADAKKLLLEVASEITNAANSLG